MESINSFFELFVAPDSTHKKIKNFIFEKSSRIQKKCNSWKHYLLRITANALLTPPPVSSNDAFIPSHLLMYFIKFSLFLLIE